MENRTRAWQALHEPGTSAARLAEIAQQFPEFASTIGNHPNAYPELRVWAASAQAALAQATPETQPTPTPSQLPAATPSANVAVIPNAQRASASPLNPQSLPPSGMRPQTSATPQKKRTGLLITAIATVLLLAGGGTAFGLGWLNFGAPSPTAAAPEGEATPKGKPLPPQEPMGAAVFTGAELDWVLPSEDEILGIFPDADGFFVSSEIFTFGESEGIVGFPRVCEPLVFFDFAHIAGFRSLGWDLPDGFGRLTVRQLPTAEQGNDVWASWEAASTQCASYTYAEHTADSLERSFTLIEEQSTEFTQGMLGYDSVVRGASEYQTDRYLITVHHGNVIIGFGLEASKMTEEQARDLLAVIVRSVDEGRLLVAAELGLPTE